MSKSIDKPSEKPDIELRIYAYSIEDENHHGWLKVGQTTRDVKKRVKEQLKTAAINNYTIQVVESGVREDGSIFSDHEVRRSLVRKGFENPKENGFVVQKKMCSLSSEN